jgi:8-oxo-dGTP pyrophosphatase MutT (NUDIX family)
MIKPWPTVRSKSLVDFRIFKVRRDYKLSPRTGREHDFFVMDCPDWVNVIALTPNQEIILIEQYRHGTNAVELEIPGGVMDPTDPSPVAAGLRELREETGYVGDHARILSHVSPNPAFMSNTCHTVLVENCRCEHPVELDHGEDVATRLTALDQLPTLVAEGRIRHSLVVVALYHFELWRQRTGRAPATKE